MVREALRRGERLRVWKNADGPAGAALGGVAIEWVEQAGHPSSYGLLGGRLSAVVHVAPSEEGPFELNLAGSGDDIQFGLPDEYRHAVTTGLHSPIEIVVAAHGRVGSSDLVFRRLVARLSELLARGVPESDVDLWGALGCLSSECIAEHWRSRVSTYRLRSEKEICGGHGALANRNRAWAASRMTSRRRGFMLTR